MGLAALLSGAGGVAAHAAGLPDPVATATGGVTGAVTGATTTVTGAVTPLVGSATSSPTPRASQTARPASGDAGSQGAQTPSLPSAGSSSTSRQASPPPARRASGSAATPAATLCLIPTGASSPAVELNAQAAGVDLSSPAIEQFPQAFTPCPAGAVPASDVAAVDAAVQGLLGACVRVTRQVVPVQTTIVVLDQNLIEELEAAGVPLQELVVPCPASGGGAAGPGAGTGGTSGGGTVTGASSTVTGAGSTVGSTLPGRLAFTGGDLIRLGLAGALLLALGLACTRRALALSAVAGRG